MFLEDLEHISIDDQKIAFPKHYHETFCISLIKNGIEQIDFEHHSLFSEKGSISITNPYEIHSNPLFDKNTKLQFDTLYISVDLMKQLLDGKNITFLNRKIKSEAVNQSFIKLINAMDAKNISTIEIFLKEFIEILKSHSQENEEEYVAHNLSHFTEINNYIENHIQEKFNLDELAKIANINKYGFVKKFKASTGMTPMNYILMKKIFSSKNLIDITSELTEIAYQYSFTDLAHFSKTFKRFIGISPKMYQKNIIDFS